MMTFRTEAVEVTKISLEPSSQSSVVGASHDTDEQAGEDRVHGLASRGVSEIAEDRTSVNRQEPHPSNHSCGISNTDRAAHDEQWESIWRHLRMPIESWVANIFALAAFGVAVVGICRANHSWKLAA